ncbi:MAG: thioredoxin family protein [Parcubacteria group bacterium]
MQRMFLATAIATVFILFVMVPRALASDSSPKSVAIYDTLANTATQISDALTLAKQTNRRILIQWGANWCGWCRLLHGMLQNDKLVHRILDTNYVWVLADVGTKGKNAELLAKYGVDPKKGIPFLTILDDSGSAVANQDTGTFETGDKEHPGHDRAKVIRFLTSHAVKKTPPTCEPPSGTGP